MLERVKEASGNIIVVTRQANEFLVLDLNESRWNDEPLPFYSGKVLDLEGV